MLVAAIVIHLPDFFVAGAAAHENDLGFGDAVDAAAQPEDDFVRKFMGDNPGGLRRRRIRVLLPKHLRRIRILHIV